MWVTQTYLGDVEPDAKLFIYYFYEDYNSQQRQFTEAVQRNLEELGDVYGENVSLMMPNSRYAGSIEAEVREFPKLWMAVREMLPGLLLSPVPFAALREKPCTCNFIPFKGDDPGRMARVIQNVRGHADRAIEQSLERTDLKPSPSLVQRLFEAVEIKPGIWGLRLDLKKLVGG